MAAIATDNKTGKPRFAFSRLAPGAVLVAAAGLRFAALGRNNLWFDELYNVWTARFPLGDQLAEGLAAGHPPLYYLVARAWFSLGENGFWVRSLSALAGVVLVWLMYLLGRELASRQAGLWAAALTAVSPMLIGYSRAATFYSLLLTLTALTLLLLVRAAHQGGTKNWAGFVAALTAVYLTSFFAAVLQLACFAAYWQLRRQPGQTRPFLYSQAPPATLALAALIASRYSIAEGTSSLRVPPISSFYILVKRIITAPLAIVGGDPQQNISMGNNWVSSWMVGAPARPLVQVTAMLLAAALLALLVASLYRRRVDSEAMAMLVAAAVLTTVTLFLVFVSKEQLTSRFYAWAAPPALVFVALLLSGASRWLQRLAGGAVLAASLLLTVWGVWLFPAAQDYISGVGNLLQEQYQAGDLVYALPMHDQTVINAYYLPDAPLPAGGFPGFLGEMFFMPPGERWNGYRSGYWIGTGKTPPLAGADLESRVAADIRGQERVWLIMPESFADTYPEISAPFDRELTLRERWVFSPMTVALYQR